jgi:putative membrane protein
MVADHTKANEELQKAASAQGIKLPTELDSEGKDRIGRLQGFSGKAFDDAYKTQMVDDHKTAVALVADKVRESPNTPIGRFAADTLQTLRSHLQMAEDLAGGTAMKMNP